MNMNDYLIYKGYVIKLVPDIREGKLCYIIFVNTQKLFPVSNRRLAKSIAVKFIDTLKADLFDLGLLH